MANKRETFIIYTSNDEIIITTRDAEQDIIRDWFKSKYADRDIEDFSREVVKGAYAVLIKRNSNQSVKKTKKPKKEEPTIGELL